MAITINATVPDMFPGRKVTVSGTASSSSGTITEIHLVVNGCRVQSTDSSPFAFDFVPECGTYVVSVQALDSVADSASTVAETKTIAAKMFMEYWRDLSFWNVPEHEEDVVVDSDFSELVITSPAQHNTVRVHNHRVLSSEFTGTDAYTESDTVRFPITLSQPQAGFSYDVRLPSLHQGSSYEHHGQCPSLHVNNAGIRPVRFPTTTTDWDGSILLAHGSTYIVELAQRQMRIFASNGTTLLAESPYATYPLEPLLWPTTCFDNQVYRFGGFMLSKTGIQEATVRIGRIEYVPSSSSLLVPDFVCSFSSYQHATSITVGFSSSTPGMKVAYSLDGYSPLRSRNTLFCEITDTVSVTQSCIFKALLVAKSDMYTHSPTSNPIPGTSLECSQYLVIGDPIQTSVPLVSARQAGGPEQLFIVVVEKTDPSSVLYYTTNGTNPTIGSSVYTHPIVIEATTDFRVVARASGKTDSHVVSRTFTVQASVTPNPGHLDGSTLVEPMQSFANWRINSISTPFSVIGLHNDDYLGTGASTGMRTLICGRNAMNDLGYCEVSCLYNTGTSLPSRMYRLGNSEPSQDAEHGIDFRYDSSYFDAASTAFWQCYVGLIGDRGWNTKLVMGWDTAANPQLVYETEMQRHRMTGNTKRSVGIGGFDFQTRSSNIRPYVYMESLVPEFTRILVRCGRKLVGGNTYTRYVCIRVCADAAWNGKIVYDSGWLLNTGIGAATQRPRIALQARRGEAYHAAAPVLLLGTFLGEKSVSESVLDTYMLYGTATVPAPLSLSYHKPAYGSVDDATVQATVSSPNGTELLWMEHRNLDPVANTTSTQIISGDSNIVPKNTKPRLTYSKLLPTHAHHSVIPIWSQEQTVDLTYPIAEVMQVTNVNSKGFTVSYKQYGSPTNFQLIVVDDDLIHPITAASNVYYDKHFSVGPGTHKIKIRQHDTTTARTAQAVFDSDELTVVVPSLVDIISASMLPATQAGVGQSVAFSAIVIGENPTYLWDFGDGSVSTQSAPTHVYTRSGSYRIRLTVSSNNETAFTTFPQALQIYGSENNQADMVQPGLSSLKVS